MDHNRFDVIVVGGGPAGITAATALARRGFSVLVCEAAVYAGAENWSGAVYFTENLESDEAFGRDAVENGPFERRVVERGFYLYNGHALLGAALRDPAVFRSSYTVLRPVFDRYLAEVAREHGAVVMNETTVQSLIRDRGRVIGVHTERGAAYADVVFLAEGDASHLVTQEGYETVGGRDGHRGPHFLQGIKEVVSLPPEAIEERFGLPAGGGGAYEMLLRNGSRHARTVRLNAGGFIYTNRDSVSLGLVLPVDNLAREFDGDHNLLMEWFKGLPEVARWIDGGEVTSYGTKIIRGGGLREIPRLVDDGLAIGGAASGIGIDFPYPNFTGPATKMGLLFARAVARIAEEAGGSRGGTSSRTPYTAEALSAAYLTPLRQTHYYRNVERLADWPDYIERTQFFFERQLDVVNGAAYVLSRPDLSAPKRWWEALRLLRRAVGLRRMGTALRDTRANAAALGLGRAALGGIGAGTVGRWVVNTVRALVPGGTTTIARDADTGVATARTPGGGSFRGVFRVMAGAEEPGRAPWLARWYWKRLGPALGGAFADVYTNDDEPLDDKLPRALGRLIGTLSIWDPLLHLLLMLVAVPAYALQAAGEWLQYRVLRKDPRDFLQQYVTRLLDDNRARVRLDDDAVVVRTSYDHKLATIRYREGERSHIKVMWPDDIAARGELAASSLWSVCPAKVYEVQRHPTGMPGVIVNYENCVKCETCWRATDDVHWSRATSQRLIYETYTPTHAELRRYLMERQQPVPRLRPRPGHWAATWDGVDELEKLAAGGGAELAAVGASLARVDAALQGYATALGSTPLTLERGQRAWLEERAAAVRDRLNEARSTWGAPPLEPLREALGDTVEALWQDAARCADAMVEHSRAERFFWADVVGRQLRDHHLAGFAALLSRCGVEGETDVAAGIGGDGITPAVAHAWSEAWVAVESRPGELDTQRAAVIEGCAEHLDVATLRALEAGEPLDDDLRRWLRNQLAAAGAQGRASGGVEGAAYGRRDVLLEELAAVDPSLATVAAQHLLACDLLAEADGADAAAVREGASLATVVAQGSISNRPLVEGAAAEGPTATVGADGVELHGEAPLVFVALADWLLVVRERRVYLVPVDDPGVRLEDVGSIGLIGAAPRRVVFDDCVVPAERIFDVDELVGAGNADPAVGEPWAGTLPRAVPDHLAIVRGAGTYLMQRARDHAAGRVQFPGNFQDEAGRDTIAKFGAVKQLLAEMEAQRVVLESLTVIDPAAGDVWLGAAVRKVLAADAFGPQPGSFSYNCGQVFGGTAFSEDDDIAKYYRDSSPFRFLIAHDDALRVEIGRRRLEAAAAGVPLVPLGDAEAVWLASWREHPSLGPLVRRYEAACAQIDAWAGAAAAGDDGELEALRRFWAGDLVARALAVKVCVLRSGWRLESGLAAHATLEATRLLVDRFDTELPGRLAEAGLLEDGLRVGAESIVHGDFERGAEIPDAEPYEAVLAGDDGGGAGAWLLQSFDDERLRYVPEMLWTDPELRAFREQVEAEQRARYVEPRFDGLTYNRYLEKLHKIPQQDLDYLIERGYMRMPIPAELGGEGALKAAYYTVCEMTGRYGDAALSLAIMANTSIGTTPFLLGLEQDLPRARAELEKVQQDPTLLGDIRAGLDRLLADLERPDPKRLQAGYETLAGTVQQRILKSSVLKYIGAGFLRAFFAAGKAGQRRDLEAFAAGLGEARELLEDIVEGVDDRLREYPLRERTHELYLKMISAGYISAFALTEPTAGSDSGGVKTSARLHRRRVHRDNDGVLYFHLDEEGGAERRNLLDAARVEFDFDGRRMLYRYADDAPPSEIRHDEYDYEKDRPGHWRTYMHGERKVAFTDIAEIREDEQGDLRYEFWQLNGAKMWITNGRFAHLFALYANTEPEGVTGFMVDRHAEGLVVGSDEEKLGQRGSPTNELSLNNVRVPRECIIGFRGRGQVNALETLNTGRTGLSVATRSTIQEMMEDAVGFLAADDAGNRTAFPRQATPATPLQTYWMGRLTEELVCTAAVAHELIGLSDHPRATDVRMESAIGKYWNSESEHEVIEVMERLRGLDGLTHRHRIEKTRRDARVLNIYEGTNEVQRYLVLRDLLQRVLPAWRAADAAATAPERDSGAYPDLRRRLEGAKRDLMVRLDQSDKALGTLVWANVNLQPCFFRLAEIAGIIKVLDAVLYRLEWLAAHEVPEAYRERVERASRLAFERCLLEIETLDRRFARALGYVQEGRYPPAVQLAFLSLDAHGAAAESLGVVPAARRPAPPPRPLAQPVRIAVLAKPVPVVAPRPRFRGDDFAEALYTIDPVDVRSLSLALDLKRRDPERVEVGVYTLAAGVAEDLLRQAVALGADDVTLIEAPDDVAVLHDPAAVSRLIAGALATEPADLVLCGAAASDTEQGAVGPLLAGLLGRDHVDRAVDVGWARGDVPQLRVSAARWQGHELEMPLPRVVTVEPPDGDIAADYELGAWVGATTVSPRRIGADRRAEVETMPVWHGSRPAAAADDRVALATTPEEAAAVLLEIAGLGGGGQGEVEPYRGEVLGFGQQPGDGGRACLFVCDPVAGEEPDPAVVESLEAADRLARGSGLPLDVAVPLADAGALTAVAGRLIAAASPRRIFAIRHPEVHRLGWRGHLEWLQEFWGMYRGEVVWLLGSAGMDTVFARFAGQGPPGVDRSWPWFGVQTVGNGSGPLRLGSAIFDGAGLAMAVPPLQSGLRIVTFAPDARVELEAPPAPADRAAPQVFLYEPRLEYRVADDPVAELLARLGGAELTLSDADYIVDVGYGAGSHEELETLARPLLRLLVDELGLGRSMIGATRKVTQDLETLPDEAQIGQTGVRVDPKLLIAMAVSGAPQHVDWIGDAAVILAFNTDPTAPLMRLNEQRARPIVHPIVGDVHDTIPRFIAALRQRLGG